MAVIEPLRKLGTVVVSILSRLWLMIRFGESGKSTTSATAYIEGEFGDKDWARRAQRIDSVLGEGHCEKIWQGDVKWALRIVDRERDRKRLAKENI